MAGCVAAASADEFFQLVERAVPAALMAVARGLIEKRLVMQRQQRAVAVRLQRHRDLRFALRRRVPGPAEHQQPVRHHLAIDAADFAMFAIFHFETDAITAADARVDDGLLGAGLDLRRPEPAGYFLRAGPRRVDFLRGCVETALEGEARQPDETGGVLCDGHL